MSESSELTALKAQISATAGQQLDQVNARIPGDGPGRQADSTSVSTGWFSCDGKGIGGTSHTSTAVIVEASQGSPFTRIDNGAETYFVCVDNRNRGDFPFLLGETDNQFGRVALGQSTNDPQARWIATAVSNGFMLKVVDGPGPKKFLSSLGMVESGPTTGPFGTDIFRYLWTLNPTPPTPPPPPPPPAPNPPALIKVEAFWWGFHFAIPEPLMSSWTSAGLTASEVLSVIADATGPAAIFVDALSDYLEAEFDAAQAVDNASGNHGVFVSMTWFVPGVFVPTPMTPSEAEGLRTWQSTARGSPRR